MSNKARLTQEIVNEIRDKKDELIDMSRYIWENPELGYKEYKAVKILADYLEENNFEVTVGVADLETAFVATKKGKKDGPTIAFLSEYDSLGQIGHACGHNLFSVSSVGAGIGLSKVLDEVGGTIMIIGTPAEEGIVPMAGGKVPMIEKGIFKDVDMAMMCHAEGRTIIERELVASTTLVATFKGKAAHAGGSPHEGVNALSAGVLTINNVNALRQHFLPRVIANIVLSEGGIAANTIPDKCTLKMSLRADKVEILEQVIEKITYCIKAGAMATGCEYEINMPSYTYENLIPNHNLGLAFKDALDFLGIPSIQKESANYAWDIGNVSRVCPVIAPYIKIGDESLVGHTDEFRNASNSEEGYSGMIVGAKAMAITSLEYLMNKDLRNMVSQEFLSARK